MNSAPQKLVIPNKLLTSDAFLGSGNSRIAFILRSLGLMPSLPKRSLEFLGHIFGNEGISPSDLKIKAILGLPDPKNASEVRSQRLVGHD